MQKCFNYYKSLLIN